MPVPLLGPIENRIERSKFARTEQAFRMQRLEFQPAEIIVPAFEICRPDRPADDALQQRNVLVKNLILECLRSCGDENPPAVQQCREQVSERLSGSCPRLNDDVALFFERAAHGFGHAHL